MKLEDTGDEHDEQVDSEAGVGQDELDDDGAEQLRPPRQAREEPGGRQPPLLSGLGTVSL